jgi:hypothetical protein
MHVDFTSLQLSDDSSALNIPTEAAKFSMFESIVHYVPLPFPLGSKSISNLNCDGDDSDDLFTSSRRL